MKLRRIDHDPVRKLMMTDEPPDVCSEEATTTRRKPKRSLSHFGSRTERFQRSWKFVCCWSEPQKGPPLLRFRCRTFLCIDEMMLDKDAESLQIQPIIGTNKRILMKSSAWKSWTPHRETRILFNDQQRHILGSNN